MKKETFRLIIRFLVGTALSLMLCAGMIMTEKLGSNKPLIQQASGLKGTETVMTVDGEPVSAEEYLYMVSYSAQTMSYYGITDLSTELGEGYTAADYVAEQAESQVVQQAVIRKWAKDVGITLTEEDQSVLQAQKDSYGDDFQMLLKVNGISEAQYDQLIGTSLLYDRLYSAYCAEGGNLRPSDSDLTAMAENHGLMTADVLFISTAELDDDGKADAKALMEDYARLIGTAEDRAAAFAALETGENVTVTTGATYDNCEETVLNTALAALAEDEVSGVIEDESGFYVALRRATDLSAVAEMAFGEDMSARMANAQVEHNDAVYSRINVAAYYTKFSAARQKLYAQWQETQE